MPEKNRPISVLRYRATQLDASVQVANAIQNEFQCQGSNFIRDIAKLTVVGTGLRSHTGVAIGMFRALRDRNINVELINTSEVRVNVVVDGINGPDGIECLRKEFESAIH